LIELLLGALIFVLAIAFVVAPLRRRADVPEREREQERRDARLAELEARKEAKYRELRDAELDRASGKLSEEDFGRQDAELRREAVEILDRIDREKNAKGPG
jgi:hypothetical protein